MHCPGREAPRGGLRRCWRCIGGHKPLSRRIRGGGWRSSGRTIPAWRGRSVRTLRDGEETFGSLQQQGIADAQPVTFQAEWVIVSHRR